MAAEHNSVWRDGFLFVGNNLALDFLNTCPLQNGEPTELLPNFTALLRWFRASGLLNCRHAAELPGRCSSRLEAARVAEQMRAFREKLRSEVLSWSVKGRLRPTFINELNLLMRRHPMLWRVEVHGAVPSVKSYFELQQPADLFAPLVHGAANLFSSADRLRVRQCSDCVLLFLDVSKKGSRHWCSMQLCGNRAKVAAYAGRQRKGPERK